MSHLQKQREINKSHPSILCQSKGTMTAFVLFVRHCVCPSFYSQRETFKLVSLFCVKNI